MHKLGKPFFKIAMIQNPPKALKRPPQRRVGTDAERNVLEHTESFTLKDRKLIEHLEGSDVARDQSTEPRRSSKCGYCTICVSSSRIRALTATKTHEKELCSRGWRFTAQNQSLGSVGGSTYGHKPGRKCDGYRCFPYVIGNSL